LLNQKPKETKTEVSAAAPQVKKYHVWAATYGVNVANAIANNPDLVDEEMTDEEFQDLLNPDRHLGQVV
jgi:hypothetical protein